MSKPQVQFIEIGGNAHKGAGKSAPPRRLAVLHQSARLEAEPPAKPAAHPATGAISNAMPDGRSAPLPGIFWLQGFKSQMTSLKATALVEWTQARGLALTRFDYSGHGQSSGRFEDGTIGDWLDETAAVFNEITSGPQILVGSSMGGWLALLLLRRAVVAKAMGAERIKGLVLIAPAWDMTQELMWLSASAAVRKELEENGRYLRPSAYGDEPYVITMKLIEEGRNHLIKDQPFDPGRPISILHGKLDVDVPFAHSQALQELLPGDHVSITAVADGEHRLSRPQDLDLLCAMIEAMIVRNQPRHPSCQGQGGPKP